MTNNLTLQKFLPYRCVTLAERISTSLSRIYAEQFGVNVAEWRILTVLAEHHRLQASDVGQIVRMDKVKVSRAVASLVERGLLLRTPSKEDGRASDLRLSAAGKRLYRQIVPRALAWEQSLVEPLTAREQETLFRIFEKLEARVAMLEDAT
jgi:DNA-binding MarR family transcriptional regulator